MFRHVLNNGPCPVRNYGLLEKSSDYEIRGWKPLPQVKASPINI